MTLLFADHEAQLRRPNPVAVSVRALARGFAAWRAQRARRIAMLSLMDLEPHRLDDLGITVQAVRDALDAR